MGLHHESGWQQRPEWMQDRPELGKHADPLGQSNRTVGRYEGPVNQLMGRANTGYLRRDYT